jgi:hypothetical protein
MVQDGEIRKLFQRTLTKQGFKWKLGMKVLQQLSGSSCATAAAERIQSMRIHCVNVKKWPWGWNVGAGRQGGGGQGAAGGGAGQGRR